MNNQETKSLRFIAVWPDADSSADSLAGSASLRIFSGDKVSAHGPLMPPAVATTLADCLPPAACNLIRKARGEGVPVALLLDSALSTACQAAPWETLRLDGTSIGDTVIVVRCADACFTEYRPGSGRAEWLNLFPRDDFDFAHCFHPLVEQERLSPRLPTTLHRGLDGLSDFFIFAHGTAGGLRDKNGNAFVLPLTSALPERIWLLACNRSAALDDLSRQLLARGASTVITAVGDLDAREIAVIVSGWLSQPDGTPLLPWLASQRHVGTPAGGARALTVWGKVSLHHNAHDEWNARTWHAEYAMTSRTLCLDENDRSEFDRALRATDSPALWPATRYWLFPQLLWLAEKFGHRDMLGLIPKVGGMTSAVAEHALADSAYRLGQYPEAAAHLASGLSRPMLADAERAPLLGGLANLLIDLNLANTAYCVTERHEDCALHDPNVRGKAALKRQDWRARIAMRQGKLTHALQSMARKRLAAASNDGRELAWQLYIGTWNDVLEKRAHADTAVWANDALKRLQHADLVACGDGNHDESYLVRALAAFSWGTRTPEVAGHLMRFVPTIRQKLELIDPGPWAFSLAYLHLAGMTPRADFDNAMHALTEARYFLEAAALFCLSGELKAASGHLRRYQERRLGTLEQLAPIPEIHAMALVELRQRQLLEHALSSRPDAIVTAGLMPM